MKIVVYSSLFPCHSQPTNGLFVSELVRALSEEIDVSVIKPINILKDIKKNLSEPRSQQLEGKIDVRVPFFYNFPKVLKKTDASLMAFFTRKVFRQLVDRNTALVHAHFAYPDAAAAGILAAGANLPLVVTVHGSDIRFHARDLERRRIIQQTLNQADAVVCVSRDLKQKVIQLGTEETKVHHIPNGVDTDKFRSEPKQRAKDTLGIGHLKRIILAVGNLIPIKAHDHLIMALPKMDPDINLVLVGQGNRRRFLEKLAETSGVSGRVHFAGTIEHKDLFHYFNASDFLVIPSHSEGWPTVIFEAFACGLPVLGNDIGGIPEAISSPQLGMVMKDNHPETIAETVLQAYKKKWGEPDLLETANINSWVNIAWQYGNVYRNILPTSYS